MKDNFEKGNLPPFYTMIAEGFSSSEYSEIFQKSRLVSDTEQEFIQTFEPSSIEFDGNVHGLNSPDSTKCRSGESNVISFVFQYNVKAGTFDLDIDHKELKEFLEETITSKPDFFTNKNLSHEELAQKASDELHQKIRETKPELYQKIYDEHVSPNIGKYRLSFNIEKSIARSLNAIEILNSKNDLILKITDHNVYFDVELFDQLLKSNETKLSETFKNTMKEVYSTSKIGLKDWFKAHEVSDEKALELEQLVFSKLRISDDKEKLEVQAIGVSLAKLDYLATSKNEYKRSYSEDSDSKFKDTMKYLNEARNKGFKFNEFFEDCSKSFSIDGVFDLKYDSEMGTYFPNIGGHSFINFGYGYSQIASIIFKVAEHIAKKYVSTSNGGYMFNEESSLMILEEPEANLHPKFQSLLADFFVEVAETFKIQFIIETHSEYLIRKLQVLTARKDNKVNPTDTIIYYFYDPNNIPQDEKKQVKKIEILEDGSLSDDFGPNFFDEAANWELELIRLKNSKNRNN
ncbi:hypothetical protein Dfri01_05910 [Dyadobacter frigoris]|nr:hypothetical protein Dfri01_05910 [Dyadobacter frigoris]